MQLMHVYVQKSTSTTRPRSELSGSGRSPGVLNQSSVSVNSGAAPSSGSSCASASRVAWLALGAAVCSLDDELSHAEEPFAGANFGLCPVIWSSRLVTAPEH